ncbi:MAG: DUF4198 domain-containing protein [Nitrospirota bacterium]
MIDSFYSSQFAKAVFACSSTVTKPVGLRFEIIPLKNPFTLKDNELLPIRVLLEGKPLEGITIETGAHQEITKTDKDGIAKIKIERKGMQVILAKYRIATKDNPDADYLSYTTVLTFEVK